MDFISVFDMKEQVQVLDPATKIWEDARIIGFEGSFGIRVKYLNWPDKLVKRFGSDRIEVSPNTPQNCWPVRKCIVLQDVRGRRKSKKPAETVFDIPDPRKRQLGDRIFFTGTSRKSPADIPSLEEVRKDAEESKLLNSGYVVMNDPFQQNMAVSFDGRTKDIQFIDYEQIRPKNWTHPDTRQPSEFDSEPEDVQPSRQKKRVVETDAEPEPTITTPRQKIDIAAYIASLAEKDELLDIVPCENGIASAGK